MNAPNRMGRLWHFVIASLFANIRIITNTHIKAIFINWQDICCLIRKNIYYYE